MHLVRNDELGLSQCAATGAPLGITSADSDATKAELYERFADGCKAFNEPSARPVKIPFPTVGVAPTNLEAAGKMFPNKAGTCSDCTWYVQPGPVQKEFGFEHGMCSVWAELLPNRTLRARASECSFSNAGPSRKSTEGILLNAKYETGIVVQRTGKRVVHPKYDALHHTKTDPREWTTDKPVTDEDKLDGIRAWRRVDHPKGTHAPIFMPVFDWAALGIKQDPRLTYGQHSPHLYVDHGGMLYDFAFLYMGKMNAGVAGLQKKLALLGEAGTGKTEFWCWVAWLMDLPFYRISLRPDTQPDEFFGQMLLKETPDKSVITEFQRGRFTRHYAEPCVICLDEPNSASDDIWFMLRPALDSAAQLVIEVIGEVIEQDPYCFIGLAMNPPDPIYTGTRELSAADNDRLTKRRVHLPDAVTERDIIRKHCEMVGYTIPDHILATVMRIAERLRALYTAKAITFPWGMRSNIAVAQLTWGFDIEDAYRMAVTDGLDEQAAEVILSEVRAETAEF